MFFIFIANRKPFSFTRSPPNSVPIIIIPPSLESIRMQTKLFSKTSTAQHLFSFSQFVFLFSFYFLRETKCFRAHSPFHQKKGKKRVNEIHLTTQYHQHTLTATTTTRRGEAQGNDKHLFSLLVSFLSCCPDTKVSEASHRRRTSICVLIKMRVLLLLLFSVYCLKGCYGSEGKPISPSLFLNNKTCHSLTT